MQNQIRLEREIIQGDPDLIGEIAHRVFRQIQKILNLQNQIRLEREIIQGDPDLIGEIAHRVFRQIQKILNPTKHNNLVVGWNSNEANEGVTRNEIGLVELS